MVPRLGINLRVTLTEPICDASADILAKGVGTPASRDDVHAPNRAAKPPGPVGRADDCGTGCCGFTRAMVPADSAYRVGSELGMDWKMENRVKRPRVLPGACPGGLEKLFGLRVDRQIVPHELSINAEVFSKVQSATDNKIPPSLTKELKSPWGKPTPPPILKSHLL